MINQIDKELIEKLIKGTQLKKVVWEKSSRDSEYRTDFGSSSVTTDNWIDREGHTFVDMAIWNNNGEQVYVLVARKGEDNYKEIISLYSAAKSSYLKVDETIADIMSHLDF